MGQITPVFTMDLERNMRFISNQEYQRLADKVWWRTVAKVLPSGAKSERISWLLDSATIEYVSRLGAEVEFDDIVSNTTEFTAKTATNGLKLNKAQFEDLDGNGVQLATHWARQMGALAAYWPQKQVAKALRDGTQSTSTGYDSQIFFSSAHPVNPFDTSVGTFQNRLTGGASGVFPGACPIDVTNAATLDVAFNNFGKAIAFINGGLLMPNGQEPRMLRARYVLVPTPLVPRIQQITSAKFIAQAAATGGGSGDVAAVITAWGMAEPLECPELGSKFTNGSDTTYYIVAEQLAQDQLGGLVYVDREPFSIVYHNEMTSSELSRMNELQWVTRGRNVVGYGHPYLIFRVEAT